MHLIFRSPISSVTWELLLLHGDSFSYSMVSPFHLQYLTTYLFFIARIILQRLYSQAFDVQRALIWLTDKPERMVCPLQ